MIKYLTGDATEPQGNGNKIIAHICNNIGAWGAGFVLAINNKWKEPVLAYHTLKIADLYLGNVQLVQVTPDIFVANMIAQHGIKHDDQNNPPIRYAALIKCLDKVRLLAIQNKATVHMPKIGAGLAGGDWKIIEKIIEDSLFDIETYVYNLK